MIDDAPRPSRRALLQVAALAGGLAACRGPRVRESPRELSLRDETDPDTLALDTPVREATTPLALERPPAPAGDWLDEPDLAPARHVRTVVGHRPYRRGEIRIEAEELAGKRVVHAYGHGGGGITLSLGTAVEVAAMLGTLPVRPGPLAVIGAGVIGLSCAHEALRAGWSPTVYAAAFGPATTSFVAGGQWAPSLVAHGTDAASRERYRRMLRVSLDRFRALRGPAWGVYERPNYVERGYGSAVLSVSSDLLPPSKELGRLPWRHTEQAGRVRDTLLIEPPVFLGRLERELQAAGVAFRHRALDDPGQLRSFSEPVVLDCTGVGARRLFGDTQLDARRGHLVLFRPGPHEWLLSHRRGYVFPRSDHVVLGGSVEDGEWGDEISPTIESRILAANRRFFGQTARA